MATVLFPLPHGKQACLDEEDAASLAGFTWQVEINFHTCYAYTVIDGKRVPMPNLILPPPDGCVVDHIDHDGLNNVRTNLRIATPLQNAWNRRKAHFRQGAFIGVGYRPERKCKRYTATIRYDGKNHYLGGFATAREAAEAYDAKVVELRGEFAVTNFPRPAQKCPEEHQDGPGGAE
jgi:hypothetical protein